MSKIWLNILAKYAKDYKLVENFASNPTNFIYRNASQAL